MDFSTVACIVDQLRGGRVIKQPEPVGRSLLNATALVIGAGLFGLFALPAVFGSAPSRDASLLWLALAIAACVCLLPAIRPILGGVAAQLNRLPSVRGARGGWSSRTSRDVAGLLTAAGFIVLLQAVLRHPLVAVFGASADPFLVEASFTIVALLALLALLAWVYAAARPLLEGMAWLALDSALATTGPAAAPEPGPTEVDVATLVSPHRSAVDERTEVANADAARTEIANAEAAKTEVAGRPVTDSDAAKTEVAGRPVTDSDAAQTEAGATEVVPRATQVES